MTLNQELITRDDPQEQIQPEFVVVEQHLLDAGLATTATDASDKVDAYITTVQPNGFTAASVAQGLGVADPAPDEVEQVRAACRERGIPCS